MSDKKSVIITGAGSGIGAATAAVFAAAGYDVVVNYSRNKAGADEIVEQCRSLGANAVSVHGDIAEDADCRMIAFARVSGPTVRETWAAPGPPSMRWRTIRVRR